MNSIENSKEMTMKTITPSAGLRRIVATVLFGTLASGLAVVSRAGDSGGALQELVKYADLDVSNSQGATTLYTRIRIAAADVCRPFDNRDFASQKRLKACIHQAIADAVNQVDQPALFTVYNAKNATSKPVILASRTR
jgi:UrcA family protein